MMLGQPIASFGLGSGDAVAGASTSPAAEPAMRGRAFFTPGGERFTRSAELGLLIGLALVVYVDGRVLPRKR